MDWILSILASICMKLTSDFNWKSELKLTGSFLLNRIVPILVFFIAFLLVLKLGTQQEIDTYSLYSSLFNTFLAFGLSMVAGVRFYATQLSHKQMFIPMIKLAIGFGILVFVAYLAYIYWFLDNHLHNAVLAIAFAFTIITSFCYEFFVVYGESKKMVLGSNISNTLSLIFFLSIFTIIYLLFTPHSISLINTVTISYALSEFSIFIILMIFMLKNQELFDDKRSNHKPNTGNSLTSVIIPIISFSLPIIVINFLKKASQTQALLSLSNTDGAMGVLQTIFMVSILFATFSSAFSNNGFVAIAKEKNHWNDSSWALIKPYLNYCIVLTAILWFACVMGVLMIVFGMDNSTQPFLVFVKDNPILILAFILFEIIVWSILVYARALGDNFRLQSIWLFGLLLSALVIWLFFGFDLVSVTIVFLLANIICCLYGGFWIYHQFQKRISQL